MISFIAQHSRPATEVDGLGAHRLGQSLAPCGSKSRIPLRPRGRDWRQPLQASTKSVWPISFVLQRINDYSATLMELRQLRRRCDCRRHGLYDIQRARVSRACCIRIQDKNRGCARDPRSLALLPV